MMAVLVVDGRSLEIPSLSGSAVELSNTHALNIDPIRNPSIRENSKHQNYIADPFFPLVVLAHTLYEERNFTFYLPVYELHRRKNFFLLI